MDWQEYLQQRIARETLDVPLPRDPVEISARFETSVARTSWSVWTLVLATLSCTCTTAVLALLGVKFLLLRRAAQRLQLTAHFPSTTSMEMRTYKSAAHYEETTSLNDDELSTKRRRRRPSV